ncbi:MAG: bifunctional 4-hydroxy-2-oxoglutarate aldolase/2-dehydro-3-deoxy-phosphogluconate aldolase [Coriobacteriaceae bacterium]|uniref:bifunctional 4-hydroxy-2-oxoglutarate aldolase/2-dehydro-3-deoxy-phosphogluconate aldolase n=1 Tax=Tractidigestivibacter sp. TaxID=2847320 RepID=UPI002A911692|nr:bifunctional 4-hydroxy-2-oxoglutarate aldolase/2-dehydro-3-deoxy-phosphogluconate aldolase [Tractidigestivibacter sp.]MCI6274291.1 bifunctional 4-hydroxy-2-oxoglutarate aldolase/2-dehydro-3-deoxy-phosphogluconate aldolase [Coriobacteriaceae bacterium]MCI6548095.1 bifunctional 4-hydroxy-2-oxoglutarate aldolase/2-dehydro-3-deoxy-phosphogluconate aldolase [Coriobacteriaceae bacterium]MDY5271041.1 bifunctional 4-hydroxy-2-oxoglutarate aldolase/2-dehydro-3-deoxy-phosphogluconate aldolase [Tractidi
MYESFYKTLEELLIVPVVVLDSESQAAPMADALMAAGMCSAEVTFRTDAAAGSIRAMRDAQPKMHVGAGTVLTVGQADAAIASGAEFIVSPGFDAEVVSHCIEREVPVLPGTVTPSEVSAARKLGLTVTKFFPAAQYGGLDTIKALCAPFVGHRFMPTGGVSKANLADYLGSDSIVAVGGTWMVKPALFADGDFSQVEHLAAEAMAAAHAVRG